ncbi:MAG: hypothetical protein ABL962_04580 [Fimbriimonadaceae bacterium]
MKRIGLLVLASAVVLSLAIADGNGSGTGRTAKSAGLSASRSTAPENGLIGVKLYGTSMDLIRKFGSPDDIQAIGTGGGSIGAAGGRGTGGAPTAGGPTAPGQAGQAGGGASAATNWRGDFGFGTESLFLQGNRGRGGDDDAGLAPQGQGPSAAGQSGGPSAAGQGGAGGGGAAGGAGGTDSRILFTRWVYKRGNSRFGFIIDKFDHIIQIEAIGSADSRVVTNRGVKYGAQIKDVMTRYGAPDAYELSGNQIVIRYLIKQKVAFRFNRLETDKPHVVTGIVVAAGKA